MTRTHARLRCGAFDEIRHETSTDPLTGEFTGPSSIGQLLGNPRWEKRLLKFLQRTKIGRIGPDLIDDEIRRVTLYEGWTDMVPDDRSIDGGEQVAGHIAYISRSSDSSSRFFCFSFFLSFFFRFVTFTFSFLSSFT
jgi:hypothetical protein